ncbi:MAG: hypothetical protein CL608_18545 [Anaerolineaceae bacterium]|nr:hypothetical protein [Anaerolineaceae bacterium]
MTGIDLATEGTEKKEDVSRFSLASALSASSAVKITAAALQRPAWAEALTKPVNIGSLVVLRVAFGLLMFAGMVRFMARGWVTELYIQPQFHFTKTEATASGSG